MTSEQREIARLVRDVDERWTMLQTCLRDREWLYAALALNGLTEQLEQLRGLVDDRV